MYRASSCPSSGEWYKIDSACGVQHWLCCRRLVEKRWVGVHLLGMVKPFPTTLGMVKPFPTTILLMMGMMMPETY
jgi:hypothetical protein